MNNYFKYKGDGCIFTFTPQRLWNGCHHFYDLGHDVQLSFDHRLNLHTSTFFTSQNCVCVCQWSALCDLLTLLWHRDHTVTRSMTPRVPGNHLISTLQNTHTHTYTQTEDYSKPAPSLIFTPEHSSQIKYFILCFLLSRQICWTFSFAFYYRQWT